MGKLYEISGMGRGFDGLIVEAEVGIWTDGMGGELPKAIHSITRIINRNHVFGDRNLSFPVPPGALYIDTNNLDDFKEELQEFDSKNPNGKYLSDSHHRRYDLEVVIATYERSLTVTVLEHEHEDGKYNDTEGRDIVHTRYTENFTNSKRFPLIKTMIDEEVKKGDLDDLIFHLRAAKELEYKDNG